MKLEAYMTKDEFITKCTLKLGTLERPLVDVAVNSILELLVTTLIDERRIEIRGFGSFRTKIKKAGISRNPKTGETFNRPPSKYVSFKPGLELRERVNNSK